MVTLCGFPLSGSDAPPLAVNSVVQTTAANTQAAGSSCTQHPMPSPPAPSAQPAPLPPAPMPAPAPPAPVPAPAPPAPPTPPPPAAPLVTTVVTPQKRALPSGPPNAPAPPPAPPPQAAPPVPTVVTPQEPAPSLPVTLAAADTAQTTPPNVVQIVVTEPPVTEQHLNTSDVHPLAYSGHGAIVQAEADAMASSAGGSRFSNTAPNLYDWELEMLVHKAIECKNADRAAFDRYSHLGMTELPTQLAMERALKVFRHETSECVPYDALRRNPNAIESSPGHVFCDASNATYATLMKSMKSKVTEWPPLNATTAGYAGAVRPRAMLQTTFQSMASWGDDTMGDVIEVILYWARNDLLGERSNAILHFIEWHCFTELTRKAEAAKNDGTLNATGLLETLSEIAESDNNSQAADTLLQELNGHLNNERTLQELVAVSENLLCIRQKIITLMANQKASANSRWTREAWKEWLMPQTFDREMMNEAIDIWKDKIFVAQEMSEVTQKKLEDAKSGNDRRDITRSAFRAWPKEKYGQAALAQIFVKIPVTNMPELLEDWKTYKSSPEYQEARLKHLPKEKRCDWANIPPGNANAHRVPITGGNTSASSAQNDTPLWGRGSNQHEELKNLRYLRKEAQKGRADAATMAWFHSGELDRQLEQMTLEHGSGRYWDSNNKQIDLKPMAFEDYIERRR
jgi:hypothetical protein